MSIVTTRVASARKVASEVIHLQLAKPEGFTWKTGEFARLGLTLNGEDVFRAYSIASPAGAKTVDFFIADVKDGTLSPKLNALRENDEILIDTEVGGLLLPEKLEAGGKDLWLFASGTGAAPFMAVTSDEAVMARYERVFLVHGVRTLDETNYVSWLTRKNAKLTVISCVTREGGGTLSERIPDALNDGALEKTAGVTIEKTHSRALLCGNPGMVKSVREILKARGFVTPRLGKPGQMLVENFWME